LHSFALTGDEEATVIEASHAYVEIIIDREVSVEISICKFNINRGECILFAQNAGSNDIPLEDGCFIGIQLSGLAVFINWWKTVRNELKLGHDFAVILTLRLYRSHLRSLLLSLDLLRGDLLNYRRLRFLFFFSFHNRLLAWSNWLVNFGFEINCCLVNLGFDLLFGAFLAHDVLDFDIVSEYFHIFVTKINILEIKIIII